ncbi:vanadium-dependent haloperoxidase [Segetibacter aerophilus]|nr:vanadium-dependent haloperoxidase [Segetibacter aerophilus]
MRRNDVALIDTVGNKKILKEFIVFKDLMRIILFVVIFMVLLQACKNSGEYAKVTHDPLLYSKTVKKLNDIVLENNFPPMIAARNYAYANIAAYEVIAAGDKSYPSLAGQIHGLTTIPKPVAPNKVDFPFAALLSFCKVGNAVTFPEGSMDVYVNELKKKAKDAGMPSDIFEGSVSYASLVADSIMSWSKKDNYAKIRSSSKFTVTNEDGRWIPTPPMYAQAVEPHWMEVRTLVLDSCSQFKPVRPPKYDPKNISSTFYNAMMLVKKAVDSLTPEQKHMADFWDDNSFKLNVNGHVMYATKKFSPGGHWMNIVGIIAANKKSDFNTTVSAYAQTSIALFDAFISCWDEKFRSNYIRPETAINKYVDPEWQPYIQTPPFPEYTSGHAVISAAAAEVMTHYFGDNINYTDTSELEFGIPSRSFESVRAAANEAGMSRVFGGIHFKHSCEVGRDMGIKVGELVLQRLKMKDLKKGFLAKN